MSASPEQAKIQAHHEGHAQVVAVAGSGKTTTMVNLVLRLLDRGCDPRRILVLMFNRAAREDFEQKLKAMAGEQQELPSVRTYHSTGYRLYQRFMREGWLSPIDLSPANEQKIDLCISSCLLKAANDGQRSEIYLNKGKFIDACKGFFDLCKSSIKQPEAIYQQLGLAPDHQELFLKTFELYERVRHQQGWLSFSDMLFDPVMCMSEHPEAQALVSNKMDYCLVDEFQDTNDIQHRLLMQIAGQRAQIITVGDPDQCIYEFRGARPDYMVDGFRRQLDDLSIYPLPHTFRYGHRLALLANHLIGHNPKREKMLCIAHPSCADSRIHITRTLDEAPHYAAIVKQHQEEQPEQSLAFLVRTWSQAALIELSLLAQGQAYTSHSPKSITQSAEFRFVEALLRIASGQSAELDSAESKQLWMQVLSKPSLLIKKNILQRLSEELSACKKPSSQRILKLHEALEKPSRAQTQLIDERAYAIGRLHRTKKQDSAHAVLKRYLHDCNLKVQLRKNALSAQAGEDQIILFAGILDYFKTQQALNCDQMLEHLDALKHSTSKGDKAATASNIEICSVHRAKGLQWHSVVLVDMNQDRFPFMAKGELMQASDISAERRLAYVAMTRAKAALYIICAPEPVAQNSQIEQSQSQQPSQERRSSLRPSQFIREMHFELSDELGAALHSQARTWQGKSHITNIAQAYLDELDDCTLELPKATRKISPDTMRRVRVGSYGEGCIVKESSEGIVVRFDDGLQRVFKDYLAEQLFSYL